MMAGTPLQMGTGAGAGMHASHRHTDAYMAQMYAALEVGAHKLCASRS